MIPKTDLEKWVTFQENALASLRDAGNTWRGTGTLSQIFFSVY